MKFKPLQLFKFLSKFTLYCILILYSAASLLFATDMKAQKYKSVRDVEILISTNYDRVEDLFKEIESQTKFKFSYDQRHILEKNGLAIATGKYKVADVLLNVSEHAYLRFRQNNNVITVNGREKNQKLAPLIISIEDVTISGKVIDENGAGLPGASVFEKGTTKGTITDSDGNYKVTVSEQSILVISFLGYKTQEIEIGLRKVIDVEMAIDATSLLEVVVTGLGVKRDKNSLGYAVSSVKTKLIEGRTEGDLSRILMGKVPGLEITSTSGYSGSGTNVIIRGLSSFTGSNQALFVVDGVPYNNDVNLDLFNQGYLNSNETTNRAFDIDPNNIASVEVLKGIAATTLYGSKGVNGVILITTKSGEGTQNGSRSNLSFSQSTFVNVISTRPDFQNQYGQGDNGVFNSGSFNSWGPSFSKDGPLGWGKDPNIDDDGTYGNSLITSTPGFEGDRLPYQSSGDRNFDGVFKPGLTNITSLNFNGQSEDGNTSYNASFGHLDDKSFIPGNGVIRTNVSIGGSTMISDKLTIKGSTTFTITDQKTPTTSFDQTGAQRINPVANIYALPRSLDLFSYPFVNPTDNSDVSHNNTTNPRWALANLNNEQSTNRHNWRFELNYEINDNLSIAWRTGRDFYLTEVTQSGNRNGAIAVGKGFLRKGNITGSIWDHLATAKGNYMLFDRLKLNFIVGANARRDELSRSTFRTDGQLIVNNFLPANFNPSSTSSWDDFNSFSTSNQNQLGIFGDFTFGYDDFIFVNAAIRSDWVSNLRSKFNNAIYPGVSISFIPTKAFEGLQSEMGINYMKIRGGYGTSTRFTSGYPTDFNLIAGSNEGVITHTISPAADISFEPETITELELGLEVKFIKQRGSLDIALWKRTTNDIQGSISDIPYSAGQNSYFTNTGSAEAEGIEIDLSFDVVKSGDFTWNSRINFSSHNEILTKRDDAYEGFGRRIFTFGIRDNIGRNAAIPGESLGAITGTRIRRNEDGVPIISSAGHYIREARDEDGNPFILGDAIPDYRMNFINSISYKNFSFNFLIQHVKGGDMYTAVPSILLGRGLIKDNLEAHGNTIIIKGVTETGEPNLVPISPERYYRFNRGFANTEFNIYDASVIRLQEISVSYNLPKKLLSKTPFSNISITAQGNNLYHNAYNIPKGANIDPNSSGPGVGNNRGLDYSSNAGSKRYGFTLKGSF